MSIYILEVKESDTWKARKAFIHRVEANIAFRNLHIAGEGCRILDYDTGEVLESFEPEKVRKEEVVYCNDCERRIKKGDDVYWYDAVELDIDNEPKIDRKYFCTEPCAVNYFRNVTLRETNDESGYYYDIRWEIEEVEK